MVLENVHVENRISKYKPYVQQADHVHHLPGCEERMAGELFWILRESVNE
jgi:hypothetical protein